MTTWLDRLRRWGRALWQDVLDEERAETAHGDLAEVNALLTALHARGEAVRAEWLAALTREKQAQLDWQMAVSEADALNTRIDEALRADHEAAARVGQQKLNRLQAQIAMLAERYEANRRLTGQLHEAAVLLQARATEARQHLTLLAEQHQRAQVAEQLHLLRGALQRDTQALQAALEKETEHVARLEDRLAARADLDRSNRETP